MATDFLVKQGRVMGGVRLVTDADVAHQTDLTNIRETGTTASQAISAGTYFYLNDTLVRAKVAIASGATFTLNTNYEVVTAGALNEINNKFNYSETEHVVGKWVDGSTLYEKTVDCGALPNNTAKSTPFNISNLGRIIDYRVNTINTSTGATKVLPFFNSSYQCICFAEISATAVTIYASGDRTAYNSTYTTIRYTKTS